MAAVRPRVAALATVWRHDSHADVMLPKMLAGYDLDGVPVRPAVDVVSLYVDQFPDNDLSRAWARRCNVPIVPTVREALTLGGEGLAVDAVCIIGEHGEYPWNEKGQHLYPRRELFEQSIDVIRGAGRPVPVFNDKHLSYSWESARWMYDTARALGVPLMAGSSLPVTFRDPELELPLGAPVQEALVLSHGPTESYGFHALETLQCLVERRGRGETGVAAVTLVQGEEFWRRWEGGEFPLDLYAAALATTRHPAESAREFFQARAASGQGGGATRVPGPHPPLAFVVEYADGLRATLLNLSGYVTDFAFAARTGGVTVATAFKLESGPPRWHFNFLVHHIEAFFRTMEGPYAVERTLLTTGTLAALMDSGASGARVETPHLGIAYAAPALPWRRSQGRSLAPEEVWGFKAEDV